MEPFFTHDELAALTRSRAPADLARDEGFWARFAQGYDRDPSFCQLNYGFYHPSLWVVLDAEIEGMRELNRRGSHFKARDSEPLLEACRQDLARLAEASPEEIAVVRSSSEGLNMVLQGLGLGPGDEVVASDHDYAAVEQALGQQALRDGVVVRRSAVSPSLSDAEIVARFEALLSPRTKLVVVTHLIHFTGQILPAQTLCDLAGSRGIPVLVDAAHSFAQLPDATAALGCDFLVASLHKWLGAPLGSGLLFVRKDRIEALRPFYADTTAAPGDIRKLERLGNRPDSIHAGLRVAVRWHEALGTAVKQARLAHLQGLWTTRFRGLPKVTVHTPAEPGRFGAIGLFSLEGWAAPALQKHLMDAHGLFTAVQSPPSGPGVRIVPGMPTSESEIVRLIEAVERASFTGQPTRPWP